MGDGWGATTKTVMRLYEGLVRPILESACVVWDGASATHKATLERVHRLSLLAATGANNRDVRVPQSRVEMSVNAATMTLTVTAELEYLGIHYILSFFLNPCAKK